MSATGGLVFLSIPLRYRSLPAAPNLLRATMFEIAGALSRKEPASVAGSIYLGVKLIWKAVWRKRRHTGIR